MKKLTYLLTALYFAVLLGGCGSDNSAKDAGAPQVLNLYGWADYFDPDVISDFEKQNNCKITYDVFSNNEELLAKMQAGGAQFDIIMPSDYMVTTMRKLDMLEKLDLAKIPNANTSVLTCASCPLTRPANIPCLIPPASPVSSITKNMSKKLLPNGTICGTRNIKDMYCF